MVKAWQCILYKGVIKLDDDFYEWLTQCPYEWEIVSETKDKLTIIFGGKRDGKTEENQSGEGVGIPSQEP